jgi:mono/diheme cytochrome c family protein
VVPACSLTGSSRARCNGSCAAPPYPPFKSWRNSRGPGARQKQARNECRVRPVWPEARWLRLALLASWVAGCDLPGRPGPADRYVPPREEKRFGVLFQKNCAGCHGADGKLGPAPPLNDKLFLALVPDRELTRVIASGRTSTLMPAFAESEGGPLAADQVEVLASGIKSRWGPVKPAPSGAPPYLLPQTESGLARSGDGEKGAKVFALACAGCHGERGQGRPHGGAAGGMTAGAINDPDFLALVSDQALRRSVIAGRPDLGMPDYAGLSGRPEGFQPLSAEDVANLTALLASWRQGGPGNEKGR